MDFQIEAGKLLEAFSIQLVILAVLKQAVHICHTQAISSIDGCLSLDIAIPRDSNKKINNGSDFRESLHVVCSQVPDNVSNVIKRDFFSEVEHAEELSKFVRPGIYQFCCLNKSNCFLTVVNDAAHFEISVTFAYLLILLEHVNFKALLNF